MEGLSSARVAMALSRCLHDSISAVNLTRWSTAKLSMMCIVRSTLPRVFRRFSSILI